MRKVTTPKSRDIISLSGYNWYFNGSGEGRPRSVLGIRYDKSLKVERLTMHIHFLGVRLDLAWKVLNVASCYFTDHEMMMVKRYPHRPRDDDGEGEATRTGSTAARRTPERGRRQAVRGGLEELGTRHHDACRRDHDGQDAGFNSHPGHA